MRNCLVMMCVIRQRGSRARAGCLATVPAHRETRKLLLCAKETGEICKWAKNALWSSAITDDAGIQSSFYMNAGEIDLNFKLGARKMSVAWDLRLMHLCGIQISVKIYEPTAAETV